MENTMKCGNCNNFKTCKSVNYDKGQECNFEEEVNENGTMQRL